MIILYIINFWDQKNLNMLNKYTLCNEPSLQYCTLNNTGATTVHVYSRDLEITISTRYKQLYPDADTSI